MLRPVPSIFTTRWPDWRCVGREASPVLTGYGKQRRTRKEKEERNYEYWSAWFEVKLGAAGYGQIVDIGAHTRYLHRGTLA